MAIHDFPWFSTLRRWQDEGMPTDLSPAEYFGYEMVRIQPDTSPRFPQEVVEETEEYVIHTTAFGGLRRDHKDYSTTPEIVDYPCKTREDWERIKERLTPSRDRVEWEGELLDDASYDTSVRRSSLPKGTWNVRLSRYARTGLEGCRKAREDGNFVCFWGAVGYDKMQSYVATESLLIAVATQPDWVRDMYETDAELHMKMYEIMREGGFEFDGAMLSCDMGYRNGPVFSPAHFEQQLHPVFKRLFGYFRDQGLPVILHTDGDIKELIPFFIEEGVSCLNPVEAKAGMDLVDLKQQYGNRLALFGGIDVRAMAHPDPSVIEAEIRRKIPAAMRGGGYIYDSDADGVPDNVSLKQYQRVVDLIKKYGTY